MVLRSIEGVRGDSSSNSYLTSGSTLTYTPSYGDYSFTGVRPNGRIRIKRGYSGGVE
jgi:hypothetical protein